MTLTEARNNKRGFAGLRTKRTEIPVGTPWNCLHSSATNANFFTIRAQGLRFTYPNQLALQCETQFSFDRTGKFHNSYWSYLYFIHVLPCAQVKCRHAQGRRQQGLCKLLSCALGCHGGPSAKSKFAEHLLRFEDL